MGKRWGITLLFLALHLRAVEAPPAEVLENLDFFITMDLIEHSPPTRAPAGGAKNKPTGKNKETRHAPSAQKPI